MRRGEGPLWPFPKGAVSSSYTCRRPCSSAAARGAFDADTSCGHNVVTGTYGSGRGVTGGLAFLRAATYPSWVADAMRDFAPWRVGGRARDASGHTNPGPLKSPGFAFEGGVEPMRQTAAEPRAPTFTLTLPIPALISTSTLISAVP